MQRNEEQADRIIGTLLRTGVITAASVVFAAGVWYLARFGTLAGVYWEGREQRRKPLFL